MKLRDKKGRFRKANMIDKLIPYQNQLDIVMYKIQRELMLFGQVVYHIDNVANCIVYDVDKGIELINRITK